MLDYNIYDDIAARTGGDIYIGVVGPVRTGKSTFIKKFMELNVLDQIEDKNKLARMIDELPQSADGKTIMTTEPKFVPNEAATVRFNQMSAAVRLIDCVGFVVDGALGQTEDDKPRMVKTPWQEDFMPFEKAAEIGTQKVITEHSTVGILVTTDGSITEIDREKYIEAEEKAVFQLKQSNKPFIIILNSQDPTVERSQRLQDSLSEKYNVPVVLCNIMELNKDELCDIMEKLLYEFPLRSIKIKIPKWMRSLDFSSEIMRGCLSALSEQSKDCKKMSDHVRLDNIFNNSNVFVSSATNIDLSTGEIVLDCKPNESIFYDTVSSFCGKNISNDYDLLSYVKRISRSYNDYEGIRSAMEQVKTDGYGIISPNVEDMELAEPEIIKKGNQYGMKLKASAPSYHIVRVDVNTEISPTIGSEQQSEDLVKNILSTFENDKKALWETNLFGLSLNNLVKEDLNCKLGNMPTDTRKKIRKTMSRIVNEGKGGVLCILL